MRPKRSLDGTQAGPTRLREAPPLHDRHAMVGWVAAAGKTFWPAGRIQRPVRGRWLRTLLSGLLLVSCKTAIAPPPGPVPEEVPAGIEAPPPAARPDEDAPQRRKQAAAALTERGRRLMTEGRVDPAMRLFEQALSLAPQYGPGYYYLAEAWLSKNNGSQARAFHRQAALYLEDNGAWAARMDSQRRRIDRAFQARP